MSVKIYQLEPGASGAQVSHEGYLYRMDLNHEFSCLELLLGVQKKCYISASWPKSGKLASQRSSTPGLSQSLLFNSNILAGSLSASSASTGSRPVNWANAIRSLGDLRSKCDLPPVVIIIDRSSFLARIMLRLIVSNHRIRGMPRSCIKGLRSKPIATWFC